MTNFRVKYPELITVQDSTILPNGLCHYKGDIDINFSTPHIAISTIAWETIKNSRISETYDFECLMYLEKVNKLTREILTKDSQLLELLIGVKDGGENNELLLSHLELLMNYERSLINLFKRHQEELKPCS